MDPFVHLHVSSGYSRQYGASHPHVLVERAAEHEMDTLALTDRDGTYGAVKHAKACRAYGLRPVLGVDLAVTPVGAEAVARPSRDRSRTPVRGGAFRDDRRVPRVTFLADASHTGGRAGWAAVCRLVSAVQLAGERGTPGGGPVGPRALAGRR
ncbi:MAG: PHP domain-containing protein [Nocardioides sp.]